jgi:hypothetical protein
MREHDVTALTAAELEDSRRELAASLALARPGSPVLVPIRARMAAIDAELAGRAAARPGLPGSPACPASAGRAPGLRKTPRLASCRGVTMPDATQFRRSRAAGGRRAIANRPRRTR